MISKKLQKQIKLAIAILGFSAPVFLFIFITVLGIFWQGYSPINDYVSDLGASSSPVRFLANIGGFGLFGVIMIGFCLVLEEKVRKIRATQTATRLFLGGSLFVILLGFFHTDVGNVSPTLDGRVHTLFGSIAFIMLPVALIWYALAFGSDAKWGLFWKTNSLVLGITALLTGIVIQLNRHFVFVGTIERIGIGSLLLWMFFVSFNLLLKEEFEIL